MKLITPTPPRSPLSPFPGSMQSDDTDLLFLQDEEGDQHQEEEEEERTVKQLNLVDAEDTLAFRFRRGQAHIKVRELRSKGLSFQIWPAAHALCWYLEDIFAHTGMLKTHVSHLPTSEYCTFKQNMRVLELGAGTGMVGIVCAVLGGHCTITDLPHVTSNLDYNATLNQEAIQSSGLGGSVVVKSLRWGERADVEAIGRSFDLIVASDVVYYDHLFEPLLSTLKWLLYSPSSHIAPSLEDGVTSTTATTTAIATDTTTTNGISISRYVTSREGMFTCILTAKPIINAPHSIEDSSLTLPNITKNTTILEEVFLPVSDTNGTTTNRMCLAEEATTKAPCTAHTFSAPAPAPPNNSISSNAPGSMPLIREDTTPVVLLAHLRRWKKDSHFFKKASKLFHVTVVHKHSHEANSRTGVTIYSISRKKK